METSHEFEKGSWEHRKLVKNSIISCIIDDLNDGLIVVSFSHQDEDGLKVYQGVLLQISRQRGIPSGISFPIDHAIFNNGSSQYSSTTDTVESESQNDFNDPTQLPALPQRHTYFQEKLQEPASCENNGLRSRVGLRRFIKPPARFKNSRMSLRLRNRPVLCAKCRAFCEEKGGLKPLDKKDGDSETTTTTTATTPNMKKGGSGVTTRNRGKAAPVNNESTVSSTTTSAATCTTSNSALATSNTSSSVNTDNDAPSQNQDYSYVSFGTQEFIENYWKRPSLLPEPDKSNNNKKPDKLLPGEVMVFSKSVPKIPNIKLSSSIVDGHPCININNSSSSSSSPQTKNNNSNSRDGGKDVSKSSSTVSPKSGRVNEKAVKVKSQKSKNLKLCISKLNNANVKSPRNQYNHSKDDDTASTTKTTPSSYTSTAVTSSLSSTYLTNPNSDDIANDTLRNLHNQKSQNELDDPSSQLLEPNDCMKEDLGGSKTWGNRIRKKSALPARFREETYLSKKVFGFKRRRADEDPNLLMEEPEGSSDFNSRLLLPCDDPSELAFDLNKLSPTEASSSSSDISRTSSVTTTPLPLSSGGSSNSAIPNNTTASANAANTVVASQGNTNNINNSSNSNNSHGGDIISTTSGAFDEKEKSVAPPKTKTPFIKISFGTPGCGVTVKIPRKEAELEESTSEKAARKALKKAKKEAKLKQKYLFPNTTLTPGIGGDSSSSPVAPPPPPLTLSSGATTITPLLATATMSPSTTNLITTKYAFNSACFQQSAPPPLLLSIGNNNNSYNHPQTPSPPVLNPVFSVNPEYESNATSSVSYNNNDCDDSDQLTIDLQPPTMDAMELGKTPKKKKKEKKRKRHKSSPKEESLHPHQLQEQQQQQILPQPEPLKHEKSLTVIPPPPSLTQLLSALSPSLETKLLIMENTPCQPIASSLKITSNSSISSSSSSSKNSNSHISTSNTTIKNSIIIPRPNTLTITPTPAPPQLQKLRIEKAVVPSLKNNSNQIQNESRVDQSHHHHHPLQQTKQKITNSGPRNQPLIDAKDKDLIIESSTRNPSDNNLIQISSCSSSSSSTSTNNSQEPPQRVCISLKRLCQNSYVSCDKSQQQQDSTNNHDDELSSPMDESESREQDNESPPDSELHDYPVNDHLSSDRGNLNADSIQGHDDESNNTTFKKDDIVWGKLPQSPWWPGKIIGLSVQDDNSVRATVSWFRASTMSCVRFSQLLPFTDHFDEKYIRRRRRGQYQHAVRDALIEAHQLDHNGAKQLYPND